MRGDCTNENWFVKTNDPLDLQARIADPISSAVPVIVEVR
jgi:hypothetical protein